MRISSSACCALLIGVVLTGCGASESGSASDQGPWKLYQFSGSEHFAYEIRHTDDDGEQRGQYTMGLATSDGRTMATVDASLGDASCEATIPLAEPSALPVMLPMHCGMIAPVAMTMFAPVWMMFVGQSWYLGSRMQYRDGDEEFSFEISETCRQAGVEGMLGQFRASGGVRVEVCVSPDVPLPLAVTWVDEDGESTRVWLTEYRH